ncbi:MAG: prolipoprotein diacylglyceryl transferase, partial [Lachnospiraceae bacterium]|nr:prolipoprotein diacylglyceryl transferase [Lachnospiraceae bacterium]
IGRFLIEGLRTDQLLIPGTQIAVSQMLGLALFVFSVVLNAVIRIRLAKNSKNE